MLTIEQAIELIRDKYDDNKDKKWVHDPVAYTLYEVWKITDSKKEYVPNCGADMRKEVQNGKKE